MKKIISLLASPLFFCSLAIADNCSLSIEGNDMMQFNLKSMEVSASCEKVKVTLKHSGKLAKNVMGHNWVLVKSSDVDAIGPAGISAGLANNHVPPNDARIIAATSVVGGGESTSVEFEMSKLNPNEKYSYICTFPGHYALMKGEFKITS